MKKKLIGAALLVLLLSLAVFAGTTNVDDLEIGGDCAIAGDLSVVGDITASSGDITVDGDLTVTGTVTAAGSSVADPLSLTGTLTLGVNGLGVDMLCYGDTMGANMLWDYTADELIFDGAATAFFGDNNILYFGDGGGDADRDFALYYDTNDLLLIPKLAADGLKIGTNSLPVSITQNGTFTVGASDEGHDVTLYGETAATYTLWDESDDNLILNGAAAGLVMRDTAELRFGTGASDAGDIVIDFTDGTALAVVAVAAHEALLIGDDTFQINTTLKGTFTSGKDNIGWDCKFYGATASAFMLWDEDVDDLVFDGAAGLALGDSNLLRFGDLGAGDVNFNFDSAKFEMESAAAATTWNIGVAGNVFDVTHFGKWTSGATTDGYDYKWFGNAAGAYLEWDESADDLVLEGAGALVLTDETELRFGDGSANAGDIVIDFTDGTALAMVAIAAHEAFLIGGDTFQINTTLKGTFTSGKDGIGWDCKFYGATASAFMVWDEDVDDLLFDGAAGLAFGDSNLLRFGDEAAGDVNFNWDASKFEMEGAAAATTWNIGAAGKVFNVTHTGTWTSGVNNTGYDYKWFGATASAYLLWDEDEDDLTFAGVAAAVFEDDADLKLGTGDDFVFSYDGNDMLLEAAVNGDGMKLGTTSHTISATHFGTWTSGATTDGFDYKWFGATAATYMLWDESDDALEVGTATNYVSIDDTTGIKMLGSVDDITSVAAGIKFTTNTTKTHKYVTGQFAYVSATEISVAGWGTDVVCEGLPAGTAIDTDGAGTLTLGVVKSEAAADFIRWSCQVPTTFVDTGTATDLILEIEANETVSGATVACDVYAYGGTTPIVEGNFSLTEADGKIWYTLNLGADADIDADDILIIELVQAGADDDFDLYGYRLKYRVGIEATE